MPSPPTSPLKQVKHQPYPTSLVETSPFQDVPEETVQAEYTTQKQTVDKDERILERMPAEPPTTLPEGWAAVEDPGTGATYYHNTLTGAVTWEAPSSSANNAVETAQEREGEPVVEEDEKEEEDLTGNGGTGEVPPPAGEVVPSDAAVLASFSNWVQDLPSTVGASGEQSGGAATCPPSGAREEAHLLGITHPDSTQGAKESPASSGTGALPTEAMAGAPLEWEQQFDASTGQYFYAHAASATTQWEPPGAPYRHVWQQQMDASSGMAYYVNGASGTTSWEAPAVGFEPWVAPTEAVAAVAAHSDVIDATIGELIELEDAPPSPVSSSPEGGVNFDYTSNGFLASGQDVAVTHGDPTEGVNAEGVHTVPDLFGGSNAEGVHTVPDLFGGASNNGADDVLETTNPAKEARVKAEEDAAQEMDEAEAVEEARVKAETDAERERAEAEAAEAAQEAARVLAAQAAAAAQHEAAEAAAVRAAAAEAEEEVRQAKAAGDAAEAELLALEAAEAQAQAEREQAEAHAAAAVAAAAEVARVEAEETAARERAEAEAAEAIRVQAEEDAARARVEAQAAEVARVKAEQDASSAVATSNVWVETSTSRLEELTEGLSNTLHTCNEVTSSKVLHATNPTI